MHERSLKGKIGIGEVFDMADYTDLSPQPRIEGN